MVSFTPQGVGVVEAAVTIAFTAFGASATAGMAIGLVYRGIVFWMPFIIGAVLIQTTKSFRSDGKKAKATPNLNEQRRRAELASEAEQRREQRQNIRPHISDRDETESEAVEIDR